MKTPAPSGTARFGAKFLIAGLALAGAAVPAAYLVMQSSQAAFSTSTDNSGNNFAAGTVSVGDDDAGNVMFNMSNLKPGDTSTKCVNVAYTGSLTGTVKLYGTVAGTGLATYLTTVIEVGTGAAGGSSLSCTGFTGGSSLHNGTLAAFGSTNTNYSNGLGGFANAGNGTTKSYRVTVTVQDNNAAQGLNATANFTWEAQNV